MYTAKINMEYNLDGAAENALPKAEICVKYRGLDMEQLLLIEDAYLAQSLTHLIQAGRDAIEPPAHLAMASRDAIEPIA